MRRRNRHKEREKQGEKEREKQGETERKKQGKKERERYKEIRNLRDNECGMRVGQRRVVDRQTEKEG